MPRIAYLLVEFRTLKEDATAAPLSVDLRERVVNAGDAGERIAKVARRFGVTRPTIDTSLALRDETGRGASSVAGAGGLLDDYRTRIEEAVAQKPGVTLVELKGHLDLPVGISTLWEALDEWGLTFK